MRTREEEKELIAEARAGSESAQSTIYRENLRNVRNVCWRMMGNGTDGDELAQVAFMTFFRKIDSFRGESAIGTFLYRLAVNECLMEKRKRKTRQNNGDQFVSMTDAEERVRDFADPIKVSVLEQIDLSRAIAKLPAGYRRTLILKDVHGFEYEEIARIMGVSVGTAKSQLNKARTKMRGFLNTKANPRIYERTI